MAPLICLILLLITSHVHASLALIADGEEVVSIPTFNYFEYPGTPFEARGYPVFANLFPADPDIEDPKRGTCAVAPAMPFPTGDKLKDIVENYKESIMVMQWVPASKCGAVTLSQLWPLAKQLAEDIEEAGLPPSNTLLIGLGIRYKGVEANPYEEKYRSSVAGIADGPPPKDLHVALFGLESTKEFISADKKYRTKATVAEYQVEWEMDPWNAAFASTGFRVFNWLFAIVNIAFIGMACVKIGQIAYEGKFEFDLRNAIFVLGVVGASLYVVTLFLPIRSRARRLVTNVSGYCESTAFHMLLYLWSIFMKQIRQLNKRGIMIFRTVVFISMSVITFTFVAQMIMHNVRTNKGIKRTTSIVGYLLPPVQFAIAATFAFYSWQFYQRREQAKISPRTQTALLRLTLLAVAAFVCYLGISINNIQKIKLKLQETPGMAVFGYFYLAVVFTVRNVALLGVLGVSPPKKESTSSETSSVVSRSRMGSTTSLVSTKG